MRSLFDLFKRIFEILLKFCPEGNTEEIVKSNKEKFQKLKLARRALNQVEKEQEWRRKNITNNYYSQRDSF